MQDRKLLSIDGLVPLEERGAFKRIMFGFAILAAGMLLLYSGNRYVEYLVGHLMKRGSEAVLYGSAFGIFIHGAQVFSLILGWLLIGQGAGEYFRGGEIFVNIVLSSAGIWVNWMILPVFSAYLQIIFPLDVLFVILLTVLFQILTLNIEEGVDKGAALLLWVYSFQSLELLPTFPPYDPDFPLQLFEAGLKSQRDILISAMAGTALFLSFIMGAFLSTWLLAKYSIRLSRVRRLWKYEPRQAREGEDIRQVSMVDMRNLVHDLKNPLSAVKVTASMLHKDAENAGSASLEKTRVMLEAVGYMERMIEEILHEEQRQTVSAGSFFQTMERHVRPFSWGEEARLSIDPAAVDVRFKVNGIRLMRALFCVLDNAWRANRSAGTKGIELHVRRNARCLEIEILDNGPGFAPKGPVFRKSGWGSTGLGLAFARRVVTAHGGELVISPRTNANGSSVLISLPAADSPGSV
jgi:signal transduction histidine kinase